MSHVVHGDPELRRVIDEDREVDGLGEQELLDLYRSLVLLRTYDERSLVYHRQGRIGTYAIFWNHEAMQVGSAHALADEDWIFPSYRESAIGLLRGIPAATILQWWRGHPAGWWNPADYNVASICIPIGTHVPHAAGLAWGKKLRGEDAVAIAYFGDGATSEGAFHEGANLAAVMGAPLVLFCNNNQWAISTPVSAQTRAETLAAKAVGYGMPGRARGRRRRARRVRGDARGGRARARGRRPDADRGGQLPRGAACDRRRPARLHRPRAGRAGEAARVRRPLRALPAAARDPPRRPRGGGQGGGARHDEARDRRGGGRARAGRLAPLRARVREPARVVRGRARRAAADPRGRAWADRALHGRGDQRRVPRRAGAGRVGDGDGRGRRPRRRRLPRHGGSARAVRREPLRRHAARRGRDPRLRGRALHGGLAARLRDAVRRVLVSLPRPADHARRPLPLAHRRADGVPDHGADALRRRRPRARAARRLARGLLRPHAGREGGDPVDAGRREGAARRRDPRPRPGRRPRAEADLPHRAHRGARRRPRRPAREGPARARGQRRDARRLRRDGAALRARRRGARGRGVGRGARPAHAEAARRGGAPGLGRQDRAAP